MTDLDEDYPLVLGPIHGRVAASDVAALTSSGADPVDDLIEAGFLRSATPQATIGWTGPDQGAADRRLLQLLDTLDLTVHVLPAFGARIALTSCRLPVGAGEEQVSFVGKGFGAGDAVRRCLGEAVEFLGWLYRPGEDRERVVLDPPSPRLPDAAVLLDHRGAWSPRDRTAVEAPGWCQVRRLGAVEAPALWCPAPLCFGRYLAPDRAAADAGLDNSGCAAGANWEDALAGGLFEAIERDATGLWWLRGVARPGIDPRAAASPRLLAGLRAHGEDSGRQCWFLDLTTDIAIPVVAAVSVEPDGSLPALGVACRPGLGEAIEGAFLEMVQSELALAGLLQRLDEGDPSGTDAELSHWYDEVDVAGMAWLRPHGLSTRDVPEPAVSGEPLSAYAVRHLARCGVEAYAMDLTRAAPGIPVAKVICPGLAHFRRPQGAGRLQRVPGQLGWRSLLPEPDAVNGIPLLI